MSWKRQAASSNVLSGNERSSMQHGSQSIRRKAERARERENGRSRSGHAEAPAYLLRRAQVRPSFRRLPASRNLKRLTFTTASVWRTVSGLRLRGSRAVWKLLGRYTPSAPRRVLVLQAACPSALASLVSASHQSAKQILTFEFPLVQEWSSRIRAKRKGYNVSGSISTTCRFIIASVRAG